VRAKDIPAAIEGTGLRVYVGGETASYVDLAALITAKLPMIIGIVIALAFVLLMLAFRSIAIPLSAGVMNLVSVCASYGILVAIFQWGWGLSWLGYGYVDSVPIASYVPLMMFAVLFGLSMDYEVFLMSQITEHHNEGENDHDAIVSGVSRSAKVITSAALIMVSVFAAFILYPNPTVKQFGVGLAVAVAIDATIVRILLVPATMTLMGGFVWWFPKWLSKITPDLNIEGAGYFQWLEKHPRERKKAGKDHSFLSKE
jgi:RND superfamily putative drug exporter